MVTLGAVFDGDGRLAVGFAATSKRCWLIEMESLMSSMLSDALVFFGATGDLALQEDLPCFAFQWANEDISFSGHRCGQGRLESRPTQGTGPR